MKNVKKKFSDVSNETLVVIGIFVLIIILSGFYFRGPMKEFAKNENGMKIFYAYFPLNEKKVQKVMMSEDSISDYWHVFQTTFKRYNLTMVFTSCYRDEEENKRVGGSPSSIHRGNGKGKHACDIYKNDALSQYPLAIDLNGKVIYKKDLKTEEGKKRFKNLIGEIYINLEWEKLEKKKKWFLKKVNSHFEQSIWGMHHIINDVMCDRGYTGGVTSEVFKNKTQKVSHFQPRIKRSCHYYLSDNWKKSFKTHVKSSRKFNGNKWLKKIKTSLDNL